MLSEHLICQIHQLSSKYVTQCSHFNYMHLSNSQAWPLHPNNKHFILCDFFFLDNFSVQQIFFDIIGFLRSHRRWVRLVTSVVEMTFEKAPWRHLTSSHAEQSRKASWGLPWAASTLNHLPFQIKTRMFGSTAGQLNINCGEIWVLKMSGVVLYINKKA